MADKFLQLSRDVVDGVHVQIAKGALVVKLNDSQCEVLMRELVQTVKEILANVASVTQKGRVYRQSCKAVLQELYRVVKDAEAIIHACCAENWVQAAIILVNMDEVFVDVLFRLDWCTSALGIVIQRAKSRRSYELQDVSENITFGQVEQPRAKIQEIRQMLRGHAREDRTTLRRRLQRLQKGTGAPDEQGIVARLLKLTDPAPEMSQDGMALAPSRIWHFPVLTGILAGATMVVAAGLGVAAAQDEMRLALRILDFLLLTGGILAVAEAVAAARMTAIAESFYRFADWNLVMMSRMDFPAISSTLVPGRNWLHSVKSEDLKDQKFISRGVVADVSAVKWLGRTFARKSFKLKSPYKFMLVAEKFARLSHPHVLQVFGHSVELGWFPSGSLVMELMDGDLKKIGLASRHLLVAVDTMLQIAEGMKYLHEQDIVHGDLNATNILINRVPIPEMEEGGYVQAKVAGFGVSGEPRTGRAGWMAPELFEEKNSQRNQEQFMACDIYSFAVTCFEILTSESPFAEVKNQAEVRAAVRAGARPHLPESLPTSLQSLIRRCWDADASKRPSFSEICAELRKCKCDLMLNGDATLMEGAQGQLGVGMSRKVGAHEKPVGESPIITLDWRVAYEDNALEFFFQSAGSMSSIVGVGLKFGKVVVSASNLEVKIIDIGKETWEAELSTFTALDNMLEVVSIDHAEMVGARSHKNSINELLTGKECAEKYGVGLLSGNTVQSTDAPHDSDYCLVLHKIVEYLMLKKVDLAKIGKQCVGNGGAGSSSSGANNSDQVNNDGTWIGQTLSNLQAWLSKGKSKSNGDDNDNRSPSNKEPPKLEDESASKNTCKITVRPGAGGSFWNEAGRQFLEAPFKSLNGASIDPTLVFVFDKNGSFGKQILVTTTTSFDLGKSAPQREWNGSFGWYHNLLVTSLTNLPKHAVLETTLCKLLMENPKDTKSSVKQIDTHSSTSTLEGSIDGRLGFQNTHIGGSFRNTETGGKTFAREEAHENSSSSDMWRGFIYRDLSEPLQSSACYDFDCSLPSPTLEVLKDPLERKRYMGSGMCGAVRPTFVGAWSIVPDDTTEDSKYAFEAERTLKHLYKIGEEEREHKTIQKYHVKILVNHAMTHLCNVKGDHVLREKESLLKVMRVSAKGI